MGLWFWSYSVHVQLLESAEKSSLGRVRKNPMERLSFSWLALSQLGAGPSRPYQL